MKNAARKTCGAKNRRGLPCKKPPTSTGRCRLHGSPDSGAPKGNTNAFKHGFYSDAMLPEEQLLYDAAKVGDIDDEIKIAKVKLHRFVKLSGNSELGTLVDDALEVIQRREAVLSSYRKSTRDDLDGGQIEDAQAALEAAFRRDLVDKTEIRAVAPNYAEMVIRQIETVRKLELTRMQMLLLDKKLKEDDATGDAPEGFEVVPYDTAD